MFSNASDLSAALHTLPADAAVEQAGAASLVLREQADAQVPESAPPSPIAADEDTLPVAPAGSVQQRTVLSSLSSTRAYSGRLAARRPPLIVPEDETFSHIYIALLLDAVGLLTEDAHQAWLQDSRSNEWW